MKRGRDRGGWKQTGKKVIKGCHCLWECCSCVYYLHGLNTLSVFLSLCVSIWAAPGSFCLSLFQAVLRQRKRSGLHSLQILVNLWNRASLPGRFSVTLPSQQGVSAWINLNSTWVIKASGLSFSSGRRSTGRVLLKAQMKPSSNLFQHALSAAALYARVGLRFKSDPYDIQVFIF